MPAVDAGTASKVGGGTSGDSTDYSVGGPFLALLQQVRSRFLLSLPFYKWLPVLAMVELAQTCALACFWQ